MSSHSDHTVTSVIRLGNKQILYNPSSFYVITTANYESPSEQIYDMLPSVEIEEITEDFEQPCEELQKLTENENNQKKLLEKLRVETDNLLRMCSEPVRSQINESVNNIMQSPSADSRTKEADEAYRNLPQLLTSYAEQCVSRLESQRNTVAILRERERQVQHALIQQERITKYNRVFNEFQEFKYRLIILQSRNAAQMDQPTYRKHWREMNELAQLLEVKRQECNKLVLEQCETLKDTQYTNETLKKKLADHKLEFNRNCHLVANELKTVCDAGEKITRFTNSTMDHLQRDLIEAKQKLEETTKKITATLARRKSLTKCCEDLLSRIQRRRSPPGADQDQNK